MLDVPGRWRQRRAVCSFRALEELALEIADEIAFAVGADQVIGVDRDLAMMLENGMMMSVVS
ncbi:MAG: hypothetical protein ABSG25_14150 [Bryobacteraceae bacterium]